ncbi:MAG: 4-alpha-glucanotransferase [Promethearchaeota archaeon]
MNLIKSSTTGRYGGILLHPTSLPGEYGIGDLGPNVFKFIDFLEKYDQNLWQILPLGPTSYGNSPYQCFSAFAGNVLMISPEKLCEIELLTNSECKPKESFKELNVNFGRVIPYKWQLLERAYKNYIKIQPTKLLKELNNFIKQNYNWLDDFSVFMSIKRFNDLKPWNEWEDNLRFRDPESLKNWRKKYENEIEFQKFTQFLFFKQWNEVKKYANLKNIRIIGDIPIFVAYDSVDVWANPELYYLDSEKRLKYVAGVPPDYFSPTGQLWGNPLYNWPLMKEKSYRWWIQRIKHNLELVNILRIDHFRGFESYWQIEASETTAVNGEWIQGPCMDLFSVLRDELGDLPIIAEDLGLITPEVEDLLLQTGFPGMRVLQFAFGDTEKDKKIIKNKYLPHFYQPNTIVYTGTHDNQTTKAWFENLPIKTKQKVLDYAKSDGRDIVGDLIHLAWSSVADMAIIPFQDLLRLGDEARMNIPGSLGNNWEWRFSWNQVTEQNTNEIKNLSRLYDRF